MATKHPVGKHYDAFMKNLVDSGRFATKGEVVRKGLRLLEEREERRKAKLETLRRDIQEGIDSGQSDPWDVEEIFGRGPTPENRDLAWAVAKRGARKPARTF